MTPPARPPPTDLLLAGFFMALVAAEGFASGMWVTSGSDLRIDSPVLYLAIGLPAMATLALRRQLPIVVAVILLAANMLINPEGNASTTLAVAVAVYSIGAHSRHAVAGLVVAVTIFFGQWLAFLVLPSPPMPQPES